MKRSPRFINDSSIIPKRIGNRVAGWQWDLGRERGPEACDLPCRKAKRRKGHAQDHGVTGARSFGMQYRNAGSTRSRFSIRVLPDSHFLFMTFSSIAPHTT